MRKLLRRARLAREHKLINFGERARFSCEVCVFLTVRTAVDSIAGYKTKINARSPEFSNSCSRAKRARLRIFFLYVNQKFENVGQAFSDFWLTRRKNTRRRARFDKKQKSFGKIPVHHIGPTTDQKIRNRIVAGIQGARTFSYKFAKEFAALRASPDWPRPRRQQRQPTVAARLFVFWNGRRRALKNTSRNVLAKFYAQPFYNGEQKFAKTLRPKFWGARLRAFQKMTVLEGTEAHTPKLRSEQPERDPSRPSRPELARKVANSLANLGQKVRAPWVSADRQVPHFQRALKILARPELSSHGNQKMIARCKFHSLC